MSATRGGYIAQPLEVSKVTGESWDWPQLVSVSGQGYSLENSLNGLFFPEHLWFAAFEGNQVVDCSAEEAPGCEAQHPLPALQFAVCSLSSCPLPAKGISSHSRHSWLTSLCENLSGIISQLLKDRWFCTTKIATSSTTFSLKPTALATIKTLPFFFWFNLGIFVQIWLEDNQSCFHLEHLKLAMVWVKPLY